MRVHAPLQYLTKAGIADEAVRLGLDTSESWSCYEPLPDGSACGLCDSCRLRQAGLSAIALETGDDVGGTWYWNRYPGARFDSQAEIYQYWFSEELYKSWQPSERFPAQPETERWLNYVADKLDLKKDIQFSTRIGSAPFDEANDLWRIETAAGEKITAQFLIACCGMLSAPLSDRFPVLEAFVEMGAQLAETEAVRPSATAR